MAQVFNYQRKVSNEPKKKHCDRKHAQTELPHHISNHMNHITVRDTFEVGNMESKTLKSAPVGLGRLCS